MSSHVHFVGAGHEEAARGASGREIALRFNRALLLVAVLTLVVVWLVPA